EDARKARGRQRADRRRRRSRLANALLFVALAGRSAGPRTDPGLELLLLPAAADRQHDARARLELLERRRERVHRLDRLPPAPQQRIALLHPGALGRRVRQHLVHGQPVRHLVDREAEIRLRAGALRALAGALLGALLWSLLRQRLLVGLDRRDPQT